MLAVSAIAAFANNTPAAQQRYTFECRNIYGNPTTVAISDQWGGEARRFMVWETNFGHEVGYTPQKRCEEVTGRLDKYFSQGGIYITHGLMNNQKVICITNRKGNGCQKLLYTLKPDQDPNEALDSLFSLNDRHFAGRPLREGSCPTYISINDWLDGKRIIADEVCSAR